MSSVSCASYVCIRASRIHFSALCVSAAGLRNVIHLFVVVLGAASLAACAQSSVVTKNSEFVAPDRH
jgi:rare lipoprotein A